MPNITISNAAAQYGYSVVNSAKPAPEDFFVSGSIALKLKKAKQCLPEKDDNDASFARRISAWNDTQFPEFELTDGEADYLKNAMRELIREKKISANEFGAELGMAIGLDKK